MGLGWAHPVFVFFLYCGLALGSDLSGGAVSKTEPEGSGSIPPSYCAVKLSQAVLRPPGFWSDTFNHHVREIAFQQAEELAQLPSFEDQAEALRKKATEATQGELWKSSFSCARAAGVLGGIGTLVFGASYGLSACLPSAVAALTCAVLALAYTPIVSVFSGPTSGRLSSVLSPFAWSLVYGTSLATVPRSTMRPERKRLEDIFLRHNLEFGPNASYSAYLDNMAGLSLAKNMVRVEAALNMMRTEFSPTRLPMLQRQILVDMVRAIISFRQTYPEQLLSGPLFDGFNTLMALYPELLRYKKATLNLILSEEKAAGHIRETDLRAPDEPDLVALYTDLIDRLFKAKPGFQDRVTAALKELG